VGFNIISRSRLKEFWERHPDSQEALKSWYRLLSKSACSNFAELREIFNSADWVQPDYVVFNVRGNNYRVITRVNFTHKTFWIKHVFTHQEYERWKP
jgi:mRNA interferase HigB